MSASGTQRADGAAEGDAPGSIYFVGIGGIGMSALARYYRARGAEVAGYDLRETDLTRALEAEGIAVHYGDEPAAIPARIDLAVYTPAVPDDLGELAELRRRGVRLVKRAEALGLASRSHRTLAVAGTHGKTTTSAMAAYLMREAGADAVAFLGGISANYGTNYLAGAGEWLVAEADEYDRSFLHLRPDVATVSFIESDHLDVYGDDGAFEESFRAFVGGVRDGGRVVTKRPIAERLAGALGHVEVWTYGVEDAAADWSATSLRVEGGAYRFDVVGPAGAREGLTLAMPGRHNVENAVAAIAAVVAAGVDFGRACDLLGGFRGVARRFEELGRWRGARVISDYAHHPTEVSAAANTARTMFGSYRVIGIFQPHLFSRTRDFAEAFAAALSEFQEVVVLEIYPARERPIEGVTSMKIFQDISAPAKYLVHSSEAPELLAALAGDVLLFMGAGDIDTLARRLAAEAG